VAYTSTDIANIALMRIGATDRIEDIEGDGKTAEAAALSYAQSIDIVLGEHHWPFARKVVALALVSGYPITNDTRWSYAYSKPSDCIECRYIGADPVLLPVPFEIGSTDDGAPVILTNESGAVLTYTWRHDKPAYWPGLFVDCLAYRMAVDLADALGRDAGRAAKMEAAYLKSLSVAIARLEKEHKPHTRAEARAVRARR